jgi:hypothetical protein
LRDRQTLYEAGIAGSLTDRQLLEQFMHEKDRSAGSPFKVLVMRHGPIVLRVCLNALGGVTDAQHAFQAVLLVPVRRFRTIRQRESIDDDLYGVACRVSAWVRVEESKRRRTTW